MKTPAAPVYTVPWWKSAVIYQIYPRSFCDSDNDGVGDLNGIREKLPYLVELGINAVWLSPIFLSPMKDFGYDVADYCAIDPVFGTMADFDKLVADAHDCGIRVMLDWVGNHTSDQSEWFTESRSSLDNAKREWYVWRDPKADGSPPNNWLTDWNFKPAWTLDEATGQYYLHCFLDAQPDLNWANPEVEQAMHNTLRFWMDRGVDGFRFDVCNLIGKDQTYPDDTGKAAGRCHVGYNHRDEVHPLLAGIRQVLDEYPGERAMVGEAAVPKTAQIATYYGTPERPEMHMAFNFPLLYRPFDEGAWRAVITETEERFGEPHMWPVWVLSNHDQVRHRSRYGSEDMSRVAATVLLTLRGTPFLYAGEELGLLDAVIPPERAVDPGGRDGCRGPIPWVSQVPDHGWNSPWLPLAANAASHNAELAEADGFSMLHLYRRLLQVRRSSAALSHGAFTWIDSPADVLAYRRSLGAESFVVMANMSDQPASILWPNTPTMATRSMTENSLAGYSAAIFNTSQL